MEQFSSFYVNLPYGGYPNVRRKDCQLKALGIAGKRLKQVFSIANTPTTAWSRNGGSPGPFGMCVKAATSAEFDCSGRCRNDRTRFKCQFKVQMIAGSMSGLVFQSTFVEPVPLDGFGSGLLITELQSTDSCKFCSLIPSRRQSSVFEAALASNGPSAMKTVPAGRGRIRPSSLLPR